MAIAFAIGSILILAGVATYFSSTAQGTLAVRIHDAPASWSHVTVTFSQIAIHRADGGNGSGWIQLNLSVTQIDFLAPGNLTRLLALDRVSPGTYTQLRIIVSSVQGVLASGAPVTMTVPDGVIKTTTPFTVRGGGTTTVTLDLDLAHSIHQANGQWMFRPVLGSIDVS
jgi:hypothetical protein